MGATQTYYVPIEIWVGKGLKRMSYQMFKQWFVGNTLAAQKQAVELRKEYPKPKFIVRRFYNSVIVYKK